MTWKATYLRAGSCRHPECMVLRGGKWSSREFPSLVVHLEHPVHGHALFDTGYSQAFVEATRPFPERLYAWTTPVDIAPDQCARSQLAARGIAPTDIATVILSHLHGDHVSGLADFPSSKIVLRREAWDAAHRGGRFNAVRQGILRKLFPADLVARARWIEEMPRTIQQKEFASFGSGWDAFGDGSLVLIDLPGHAPGHVGAFFLDAARGRTFLLADACWTGESLQGWRPPHALTGIVMHHRQAALVTLRKLMVLRAADPGLLMVPSHCLKTLENLA